MADLTRGMASSDTGSRAWTTYCAADDLQQRFAGRTAVDQDVDAKRSCFCPTLQVIQFSQPVGRRGVCCRLQSWCAVSRASTLYGFRFPTWRGIVTQDFGRQWKGIDRIVINLVARSHHWKEKQARMIQRQNWRLDDAILKSLVYR